MESRRRSMRIRAQASGSTNSPTSSSALFGMGGDGLIDVRSLRNRSVIVENTGAKGRKSVLATAQHSNDEPHKKHAKLSQTHSKSIKTSSRIQTDQEAKKTNAQDKTDHHKSNKEVSSKALKAVTLRMQPKVVLENISMKDQFLPHKSHIFTSQNQNTTNKAWHEKENQGDEMEVESDYMNNEEKHTKDENAKIKEEILKQDGWVHQTKDLNISATQNQNPTNENVEVKYSTSGKDMCAQNIDAEASVEIQKEAMKIKKPDNVIDTCGEEAVDKRDLEKRKSVSNSGGKSDKDETHDDPAAKILRPLNQDIESNSRGKSDVGLGKNTESSSVIVPSEEGKEKFDFDNCEVDSIPLSPLDALIQKNIQERKRLFEQLRIGETLQSLMQGKPASNTELQKSPTKNKSSKGTPRKSSRTSTKTRDGSSPYYFRKSPSTKLHQSPGMRLRQSPATRPQQSPSMITQSLAYTTKYYPNIWAKNGRNSKHTLSMKNVECNTDEPSKFIALLARVQTRLHSEHKESLHLGLCDINQFKTTMESLTLKPNMKAKICKDRVYSMVFHPTFDGILVAAGDRSGQVSLWDINENPANATDFKIATFHYHKSPVASMSFGIDEPSALYTTSYDGTMRHGDLNKGIFSLVHATKDLHLLTNHAEIDHGVFLLGRGDGQIAQIDVRAPDTVALYPCYQHSVYSISVHPVTKHHIATTSYRGGFSIWDLRMLQKGKRKPTALCNCTNLVTSAYFSPLTGSRLLTTSYDNNISVYSTSNLNSARLEFKMNHFNETGRWITRFRAVWHPQREDVFLVGCMLRDPRRLEIFHAGAKRGVPLITLTQPELMTTIGAVAQFHPTRPLVAGGNASGSIESESSHSSPQPDDQSARF